MFRINLNSHPWFAYMLILSLMGVGLVAAFILLQEAIISQIPRFGLNY